MTNHDNANANNNNPNRERENPTAEEQQKKAEREHPKATKDVVTKTENLTLGAGDSYLLHPGATEETERAKREYNAEKQAELDRAKALDRKPDQFRSSKSEVDVVKAEKPKGHVARDFDLSGRNDGGEKNTTTTTTTNTNTKNDNSNKNK